MDKDPSQKAGSIIVCIAISPDSLCELERLRKRLYMTREQIMIAAVTEFVEKRRGKSHG